MQSFVWKKWCTFTSSTRGWDLQPSVHNNFENLRPFVHELQSNVQKKPKYLFLWSDSYITNGGNDDKDLLKENQWSIDDQLEEEYQGQQDNSTWWI